MDAVDVGLRPPPNANRLAHERAALRRAKQSQFRRSTWSVIITSSSDEKLERAKALGADVFINYRRHEDWDVKVKEATGGRGVDIVVKTAGAGSSKSLSATAFGGFVGVVGFVAGFEATISIRQLIGPMIRVQGIAVGSKARFEQMNRAIGLHQIKPGMDQTFALTDAKAAFRHMASGAHFGKVAITGF